jgi:hypothetical protein
VTVTQAGPGQACPSSGGDLGHCMPVWHIMMARARGQSVQDPDLSRARANLNGGPRGGGTPLVRLAPHWHCHWQPEWPGVNTVTVTGQLDSESASRTFLGTTRILT